MAYLASRSAVRASVTAREGKRREKESRCALVIGELKRDQQKEELALEEEEEDLSAGRRRYSIFATYRRPR